jgi:integrase
VLNRAVASELIEYNPAKGGVPNPQRRSKEKRPFESWQQIRAVADRLGSAYGPMVVFAAATGLRPSELFALEHRDIDRALGVVYVRRAYANGRLKHTKTRLSTRAVPLQAIALEALHRLPPSEDPILFANSRGGRIDFRSFGRRHWKPAQLAAGVEPLRERGSCPLMNRHPWRGPAMGCPYNAVGMQRASDSALGLFSSSTSASWMLALPAQVGFLASMSHELRTPLNAISGF